MQHPNRTQIIVIAGPTATGKSALAVELARRFGGEIISADSRQVYRGLNIGTGKVTRREMRGVPHHLLDIASPRTQVSAATYAVKARRAIADIARRGRIPIICGGTGFYIDAVLHGGMPEVPPNTAYRRQLTAYSPEELHGMLKKEDPKRAATIDRYNKVRLIRALEIVKALGKVPTKDRPLLTKDGPLYDVLWIGLTLPMPELEKRIHIRLFVRMSRGMVTEAKRLHAGGLSWKRMEELGLEYRSLARHLQGKMGRDEMLAELETKIRQYAKRQITWFKRNKDIRWFSPSEKKAVEKACQNFLER